MASVTVATFPAADHCHPLTKLYCLMTEAYDYTKAELLIDIDQTRSTTQ